MFKLVRRLIVLAAIGGAVSYVMNRRKKDDTWDSDDGGDWTMEGTEADRRPPAGV